MQKQLDTFLTGSFPPMDYSSSADVTASIRNAVRRQIEAGLDVLSDGQVRSDIVGIFARRVGLEGDGLPYRVRRKIGSLKESVTLRDLEIAATEAEGHPLKAHITGPTVVAESCADDDDTPNVYRGIGGFRQLTLDLARALAGEARFIAQKSKELNIRYLQIDEPSLVFGADLQLAGEAIGIIVKVWREAGGGEVILHVCGDIRDILPDLIAMPVDILNVENVHLREADEKVLKELRESNKKLALGVVSVNTEKHPSSQGLAQDLLYAVDRYGTDHICAVTPNCGLRLSSADLAMLRMKRLTESVSILQERAGRLA